MIGFNERNIYSGALAKWGFDKQLVVLLEELSELQKHVCEYLRDRICREALKERLPEEMADVLILLEQVAMELGVENDILRWKEHKLNRLHQRVRKDGEGAEKW